MEAQETAAALDGFYTRFAPVTGDKETRARPVSAQVEAGNVKLVRGPWNEDFLKELENFPDGKHDDVVDGLSGAYDLLKKSSSFGFYALPNKGRLSRAIEYRSKREMVGL